MRSLEEKIKNLPPGYRQEVEDFVEFILEKRLKKRGKSQSLIGLEQRKISVTNILLWNFNIRF